MFCSANKSTTNLLKKPLLIRWKKYTLQKKSNNNNKNKYLWNWVLRRRVNSNIIISTNISFFEYKYFNTSKCKIS